MIVFTQAGNQFRNRLNKIFKKSFATSKPVGARGPISVKPTNLQAVRGDESPVKQIVIENSVLIHPTKSKPFDPPETGKIDVEVINHYADEVLKVFDV